MMCCVFNSLYKNFRSHTKIRHYYKSQIIYSEMKLLQLGEIRM